MSHSSRFHSLTWLHHSHPLRHGPLTSVTLALIPGKLIANGAACFTLTFASNGGRNIRKVRVVATLSRGISVAHSRVSEKVGMTWKLSGRCVSITAGKP